MKPATQVLRARDPQARGLGIDAREILCGNVTDEQVRHGLDDIRRYHRGGGSPAKPRRSQGRTLLAVDHIAR